MNTAPFQCQGQMDSLSEPTGSSPTPEDEDPEDPQFDMPYINLVYFIIAFVLIIGARLLYNKLSNRHNRIRGGGRGSLFTMPLNAGDLLAYQVVHGLAVNNDNSNVSDRVRQQQRTKVIQTDDEVVFNISPMGNHPRRRLTVISKTQPALLRSFEATKNEKMVCALCLDPLHIRRVAAFPCNHPMHEDCFREWVVKTSRLDCPICAQDFSTYDLANSSTTSAEAVADTHQ